MRAARDGQAAISQLRSSAQVAAAHGGIGLLWRCQRDRERRGFLAPLRAFFRRHRPNAARTVQFIPSDVHRISNDAAEGDDVTTSPGSATVTYQELTAAVRGDLIMLVRRRDRARGVLLACNVAIPAAASSRPECPAGTGTRRCLPRLTWWLRAAGRSASSLPGEVGRAACPTCDRRLGVSANAGVAMPRQRILAAIFRVMAGVPWRHGTYPQAGPAQRGHPVRSPGTNANGC